MEKERFQFTVKTVN